MFNNISHNCNQMQENNGFEFKPITVSCNSHEKLYLDVFLDNTPIYKKNKKNYRVYLSFHHNIIPVTPYTNDKIIPRFYVKSTKGLVEIFANDKASFFEKGTNYFFMGFSHQVANADFDISEDQITNDSFEMVVIEDYYKCDKNMNYAFPTHNEFLIHINTKPVLQTRINNNLTQVSQSNAFTSLVDISGASKTDEILAVNFMLFDIECRLIKKTNRLDYDVLINYKYRKIKTRRTLPPKVVNRLRYLEGDFISDSGFQIDSQIVNGNNYYNIPKIEHKIETSINEIRVKTKTKSKFDPKSQKIVTDENGDEGIQINPLAPKKSYMKSNITLKGIEFEIKNDKHDFLHEYNLLPIDGFDVILPISYKLEYLKSEWNDIKDINLEKGMEFIDERQKKVD